MNLNQRPETISVDTDHHVAGLDHRIGVLAGGEAQFVDGLVGDRRCDDLSAADIDLYMRRRRTFLDVDDLAFDAVAR